jgi:hypothetical protein
MSTLALLLWDLGNDRLASTIVGLAIGSYLRGLGVDACSHIATCHL